MRLQLGPAARFLLGLLSATVFATAVVDAFGGPTNVDPVVGVSVLLGTYVVVIVAWIVGSRRRTTRGD